MELNKLISKYLNRHYPIIDNAITQTYSNQRISLEMLNKEIYDVFGENISAMDWLIHHFNKPMIIVNTISGNSYFQTYNQNGKILHHEDTYGCWETFTYNDNNDILTYKASHGNNYECEYNENNQLLKFSYSNGTINEYTYDDKGNEITMITTNGKAFKSTYDDNNNKTILEIFTKRYGYKKEIRVYDEKGKLIEKCMSEHECAKLPPEHFCVSFPKEKFFTIFGDNIRQNLNDYKTI